MDRIDQIKSFLIATPDDAFLNYALAIEYVSLKKDREALSIFIDLVKNQPEYFATYYHLGKLYERIGEDQHAEEMYEHGMVITKKQNNKHAYGELRGAYEELTF